MDNQQLPPQPLPNTTPIAPPPTSETPPPISEPPKGRFHISTVTLVKVGGIALLLIIILVILSVVFSSKGKKQSTSTPSPDSVWAIVGTQSIYKDQIESLAKEQYSPSAITQDVLKTFLNTAVERAILDQEAQKLSINITDQEISASRPQSATVSANTVPALNTIIKYQLIKTAVMAKQIKSVQAFVISYWIPPASDYTQQPIFAVRRTDGKNLLDEAQVQIKQGQKPLDVARQLSTKYPSVSEILAVNGYNLSKTLVDTSMSKPKLYTLDQATIASTGNPEFYTLLASMNSGDVKTEINSNGSGGSLIQVIDLTSSGFSTYDEFLSARKKELVKLYI